VRKPVRHRIARSGSRFSQKLQPASSAGKRKLGRLCQSRQTAALYLQETLHAGFADKALRRRTFRACGRTPCRTGGSQTEFGNEGQAFPNGSLGTRIEQRGLNAGEPQTDRAFPPALPGSRVPPGSQTLFGNCSLSPGSQTLFGKPLSGNSVSSAATKPKRSFHTRSKPEFGNAGHTRSQTGVWERGPRSGNEDSTPGEPNRPPLLAATSRRSQIRKVLERGNQVRGQDVLGAALLQEVNERGPGRPHRIRDAARRGSSYLPALCFASVLLSSCRATVARETPLAS